VNHLLCGKPHQTAGGNTAIRQGRADTLSNWKAYAAADACARRYSAPLAQNGMTGPSNVFEGRLGFFNLISRKPATLPELGEPYGIRRAFTKRFPWSVFSNGRASCDGSEAVFQGSERNTRNQHLGIPVCAENLVRFDLMTESLNVGRDGRADNLSL
jgi:hypothetical protein